MTAKFIDAYKTMKQLNAELYHLLFRGNLKKDKDKPESNFDKKVIIIDDIKQNEWDEKKDDIALLGFYHYELYEFILTDPTLSVLPGDLQKHLQKKINFKEVRDQSKKLYFNLSDRFQEIKALNQQIDTIYELINEYSKNALRWFEVKKMHNDKDNLENQLTDKIKSYRRDATRLLVSTVDLNRDLAVGLSAMIPAINLQVNKAIKLAKNLRYKFESLTLEQKIKISDAKYYLKIISHFIEIDNHTKKDQQLLNGKKTIKELLALKQPNENKQFIECDIIDDFKKKFYSLPEHYTEQLKKMDSIEKIDEIGDEYWLKNIANMENFKKIMRMIWVAKSNAEKLDQFSRHLNKANELDRFRVDSQPHREKSGDNDGARSNNLTSYKYAMLRFKFIKHRDPEDSFTSIKKKTF